MFCWSQFCDKFFPSYSSAPELYECYWCAALPLVTILAGLNFMKKRSATRAKLAAMAALLGLSLASFLAVVTINTWALVRHFPPAANCQRGQQRYLDTKPKMSNI